MTGDIREHHDNNRQRIAVHLAAAYGLSAILEELSSNGR